MNIVTHSARFHSDDVFASATLLLVYRDAKITRTRDLDVIAKADIVFDVGGEYDPEKNRFDHHQTGRAGKRPNGIEYASFGLVWKKFGEQLAGSKEAADFIDMKLVQPIDAMDNGVNIYQATVPNLNPYIIQSMTGAYNQTWKEGSENINEHFFQMVEIAKGILQREIIQARDYIEGEKFVEAAYNKTEDKRVVMLDSNYPWDSFMTKHPEVLFIVKPNVQDTNWKLEATRDSVFSYEIRKYMPEAWAGLRDADLAKVTGVSDAVFCHTGRFLAVAKSKEGVLKLAELALKG